MQFRISVALLLALAIGVGAGNVSYAGVGDGQVVAACETHRALVARSACRASLDCAPGDFVAEAPFDGSAWQGRGRALEPIASSSFRPGAARLVTRTRGPPPPRA